MSKAYKKCPRCDLNYIPAEEDLCGVCKAELKLAPEIYSDDGLDDDLVLCPACKQSYISVEEDLCEQCLEKYKYEAVSVLDEDEEDWRAFLDDDKESKVTEDGVEVSLDEIADEEENLVDEDEDEENPVPDEDDFDFFPPDDVEFESEDDDEDSDDEDDDF